VGIIFNDQDVFSHSGIYIRSWVLT
jgi:hypothetical protein